MALLKYTTEVPVSRTVHEIFELLRKAGADSIMLDYDKNKNPCGVSFITKTANGSMSFRMDVDQEHVYQVLKNQYYKSIAPKAVLRDGQAARVGWRIVGDWLAAQMALIEIGLVTLDQIFLPYAVNSEGQTVYKLLTQDGRMSRLLGTGATQDSAQAPGKGA